MSLTKIEGWIVEVEQDDPDRIIIKNEKMPGFIHLRKTLEGFIVDIWPESYEQVEASCSAHVNDLVNQENIEHFVGSEVANG